MKKIIALILLTVCVANAENYAGWYSTNPPVNGLFPVASSNNPPFAWANILPALTVTNGTNAQATITNLVIVNGSTNQGTQAAVTATQATSSTTNTASANIVNATNGYQISGSYGSAGQVATSTGTATAWSNAAAGTNVLNVLTNDTRGINLSGPLTLTNTTNVIAGTFTGNGAGITNYPEPICGYGQAISLSANQAKYFGLGAIAVLPAGNITETNVSTSLGLNGIYILTNFVIGANNGIISNSASLYFRLYVNGTANSPMQLAGTASGKVYATFTNGFTITDLTGTNMYSMQVSNSVAGTTATLYPWWSFQAIKAQ